MKPTASVYHYLEYPHALSIFANDRLRLANPDTWSDPYERWWNQTLFEEPGPLRGSSAYVLCWSRSRFDEPEWRMAGFQRTNPIVRLRCRVQDILNAAVKLAEQRPGSFFMGKAGYAREVKLDGRAKSALPGAIKPAAAAGLLLRKRYAFRFENEVRSVWLDHEPRNSALFLPIEAKAAIRQVTCSPHAHPEQKARIQQEFNERFTVKVIDPPIR